jgi:hypothetical protein
MPVEELPWWIDLVFIGFDEEGESESEEDEDDANSEDEEDEEDDAGDGEGETKPKQNTEGLKSALRKERKARRDAERELKRITREKATTDEQDTKDVAAAKARADAADAKSEKLATKLKDSAVNEVIIKVATKMKFADLDDAIALIDRAELDVDQDDDDPSNVDVDEDSVSDALKALVKKKPHLIQVEGEGAAGRSGAKMGGRRDGKSGDPDEDELRELYPALRR